MSNEIKNKLNYLLGTKQLFKTVLKSNGAPITDATPFREYVNYFGSVEEGDASKITIDFLRVRSLIYAHYYGDKIHTDTELQQIYGTFANIANVHML